MPVPTSSSRSPPLMEIFTLPEGISRLRAYRRIATSSSTTTRNTTAEAIIMGLSIANILLATKLHCGEHSIAITSCKAGLPRCCRNLTDALLEFHPHECHKGDAHQPREDEGNTYPPQRGRHIGVLQLLANSRQHHYGEKPTYTRAYSKHGRLG